MNVEALIYLITRKYFPFINPFITYLTFGAIEEAPLLSCDRAHRNHSPSIYMLEISHLSIPDNQIINK